MFKIIRPLTTALLLSGALVATAQCGTRFPATPLQVDPTHTPTVERGGPAPFIVPTVVHIHYGGGVQPLGALRVMPLLRACNEYLRAMNAEIADVIPEFAGIVGDMGIELRLATRDEDGNCMSGIRYHTYDPMVEGPNALNVTLNTRHYLNIHIFPSVNSFATLPGSVSSPYDPTDVIVLSYVSALYPDGSLVHEVGHWGGLLHTFGPYNQTGQPCGDDNIADTPPTAGSPGNCVLDLSDCQPDVIENVQNHMDYSNCRAMFTQGQAQYVASVLSDPAIVRAGVVSADNLLATGVTAPATCPITGGIYYRPSIACSGTTISYRAMAEHAVADSVRWTFTGGNPVTSTDDHASAFYAVSGNYPVQLIVYGGGGSALVDTTVAVDVPDPDANGLSVISTFPFTEGFENGFTLPQPNMFVQSSASPSWQPFVLAGYASAQSLYVPAEPADAADTNDLVMGNFDMSSLTQATVQLKVATSLYPLCGWSTLQLLFHDHCSNIFVGDIWATWDLTEMAGDNGTGFVPSDDDQWMTLTSTHPEWNLAHGGEFVLRLIRPAMPASFTPEAFYIDDLYLGELPVLTGVAERSDNEALSVVPNPNTGACTVHVPGPLPHAAQLRILNGLGQVVHQQPGVVGANKIDEQLAPGIYLVTVGSGAERMVVE